jgi:hypothetical protein
MRRTVRADWFQATLLRAELRGGRERSAADRSRVSSEGEDLHRLQQLVRTIPSKFEESPRRLRAANLFSEMLSIAEVEGRYDRSRRGFRGMTMRLKVREAKLDPSLRDFFEQMREQIVGLALAFEATRGNGNHMTQIAPTQTMNVIYAHQDEAAQGLIERSGGDAHHRTGQDPHSTPFWARPHPGHPGPVSNEPWRGRRPHTQR